MGFPSSSQVRLMICLYVVAFLVGTAIASDDLKQCACYDDAQSTCGGSEQACQDYAISTAMKLAACVVPFILILLVHFWSCCRCCGFCGAEQPSVGVCTRQAMLFTGYTRGEYATELYGSIAEPVGCAAASPMGPASGVREALELYEDAKSSFIGRVCDDYMSQTSMLCSVAFNCPASTCVDRTVHAFGTVLTESTARSSLVGCTPPCSIADCAEDCQDGTVKAAASTVVNAYNEYAPRMYAIDRELYPLASCLRVKVYLARMRGPLCGMVDSVDVTFKCLLAVQWLQVGIFIFLTLARKRFIAAARATVLSKAYPDDITGGHT
ncbi:hypothetical protein DIPPA_56131 [Diplonema papillatum]|nr:hypothetical protein DIPPA_56131 [Diplonema papillatum]